MFTAGLLTVAKNRNNQNALQEVNAEARSGVLHVG